VAPLETKLYYGQILCRVALSIFAIVHMTANNRHSFYEKPFLHYWIFIDVVIMFFMVPYMNFCQKIMIKGEIMKNIFTVYQVQRAKLKMRRECGDYDCWKEFF
jgi:hypothetical protein